MPPTHRPLRVVTVVSILLAVGACAASQGAQDPTAVTLGGIGLTPQQQGGAIADASGSIVANQALPTAPAQTVAITSPDLPRINDNRVFMVGDSVMQAMASGNPDSIDLYVGALGWKVTVDAVQGRFTDEGLKVLKARRKEVHDVAVVMLGNNYNGNQESYALEVQGILDLLNDARVILWFTTPIFRADQREVNDVLKIAAGHDPRLVLLDWDGASTQWAGALRADGIHPSPFGSDILAQMVGAALGRAPGVGPEVTLPRIGASERPKGALGTDKGENRSTPRPGDTTTTRPRPAPATTTVTRPTVSASTPAAPTTTRQPTVTTAPGGSTASTIPASTTTSGGGSPTTTPPASSTTGNSSTTTSSTTTTSTTTTTTTTTPPPATDPATTHAGP